MQGYGEAAAAGRWEAESGVVGVVRRGEAKGGYRLRPNSQQVASIAAGVGLSQKVIVCLN